MHCIPSYTQVEVIYKNHSRIRKALDDGGVCRIVAHCTALNGDFLYLLLL